MCPEEGGCPDALLLLHLPELCEDNDGRGGVITRASADMDADDVSLCLYLPVISSAPSACELRDPYGHVLSLTLYFLPIH